MKRISETTERKLMSAIEKIAELVGDGAGANDAIIKVARDAGLRPGEIPMVVHAYNTGRTSRQRMDGSTPFDKAASFELADTETICEQLYPANVKTAAAIERDTTISPEYSFGPGPMLERKSRVKAASAIDWRTINGTPVTAPTPYPRDDSNDYGRASAKVDRAKKAAEESRRVKSSAFDALTNSFNELSNYFRRPDALPLRVVKEAAVLMHGDVATSVFDTLTKVHPQLTKLANHIEGQSLLGVTGRNHRLTAFDVDCTQQPFPLINNVLGAVDHYNDSVTKYAAAVQHYDAEVQAHLGPFVQPAVSPSILAPSSSEGEKVAFAGGGSTLHNAMNLRDPLKMLGTYSILGRTLNPVMDKLHGPDDGDRVNKALQQLNDPSHEMQLREINTQAMLQDLMLNDPVISGYDPHQVTGAFNDIAQVSPSVADQRMLMQSLLRKHLQQGHLDTFDQDQLLGFEDKLRRQFQPTRGGDGSIL